MTRRDIALTAGFGVMGFCLILASELWNMTPSWLGYLVGEWPLRLVLMIVAGFIGSQVAFSRRLVVAVLVSTVVGALAAQLMISISRDLAALPPDTSVIEVLPLLLADAFDISRLVEVAPGPAVVFAIASFISGRRQTATLTEKAL